MRKTEVKGAKVMWKLKKHNVVTVDKLTAGKQQHGQKVKVTLQNRKQSSGWVDDPSGFVAAERPGSTPGVKKTMKGKGKKGKQEEEETTDGSSSVRH